MSEQSDPALFAIYENWASQAALDANFETPQLKAIPRELQCTAICRTICNERIPCRSRSRSSKNKSER